MCYSCCFALTAIPIVARVLQRANHQLVVLALPHNHFAHHCQRRGIKRQTSSSGVKHNYHAPAFVVIALRDLSWYGVPPQVRRTSQILEGDLSWYTPTGLMAAVDIKYSC